MAVAEKYWDLKLFVYDDQPRSQVAVTNLKRFCDRYLEHRCHLEIVDLMAHPELAKQEQIVAIPTLQKLTPRPVKMLIGDFTNVTSVLKGLGIEPTA
jgi:circadian clock protein KaiB